MTRFSRYLRKPELVIVPVVAAATVALLYLRDNPPRFLLLSIEADARVGPLLSYQLLTLGIALAFVLGVRLIKPKNFKRFGRWGDISAEFRSVPQIGLRAGPGENWRHIGQTMAVIVTGVTAIVIYLQVVRGNAVLPGWPVLSLWALLLAAMNSFTEESIFRFGVVGFLHGALPNSAIYLVSGILFGIPHYYGMPSGVGGVFLAGFLGWLLAKSMVETRGVFWAWLIHFLQDVVIFTASLLIYSSV